MFRLATCIFIGLSMAACAGDDATQGEQQGNNEDKNPVGTTIFSSVDQSDESAPSTRTAIVNHVKGGGAKVNWSATDKIWVKDDNGTWQQSAAASFPTAINKSNARFTLNGTYTGMTHDVIYTNTSITGTPQVEIKAGQTQTVPNNFDHAGESGDCGIAEATNNGGFYQFILNHKASYLCLIPRSSNEFVHRSKLTKIEIISDDDIAGTYDMAADGTLTLASGGSKTITLTTGTGFDLDNSADDMDKNAAYAVIAPGTHKLCIRYWLRNSIDNPDGQIEGTITKYVTMNFVAGKIHDITSNLALRDYEATVYYMWDAKQNCWWQHEWNVIPATDRWQPIDNYNPSPNYPTASDADRWCNTYWAGSGMRTDAQTPLFQTLPNANEMAWYAMKGEPHWDEDELWTTMGRLYKSGMWFLKKNNISGFTAEHIPNAPTDLRTTYQTVDNTPAPNRPSASEIDKYFYLPASGFYTNFGLDALGWDSRYWTSSAAPNSINAAYFLTINSGQAQVAIDARSIACKPQMFE